MIRLLHVLVLVYVAVTGLMSLSVSEQAPTEILSAVKDEAMSSTPSFQGFSAERGERFYRQTHGKELSCASCHTEDPAAAGKHAKSDKVIQALAPAANAERFTDPAKVEKWFKRNCNDVLGRVCTPQEKGDVIAYILAITK
jgi:hypothetical protein